MQVLNLDQIQNSIVGSVEKRGISGGQKKRVNMGLEVVSDPTVLLLDGTHACSCVIDGAGCVATLNSRYGDPTFRETGLRARVSVLSGCRSCDRDFRWRWNVPCDF